MRGFSRGSVSGSGIRFCGSVGNNNRPGEFRVSFGSISALDSSAQALSALTVCLKFTHTATTWIVVR